jgi:hypothetical protein
MERLMSDSTKHLIAVLRKTCTGTPEFNSFGIPAFAAAMRHLAEIGMLELVMDNGSWVSGKWIDAPVPQPPPPPDIAEETGAAFAELRARVHQLEVQRNAMLRFAAESE